MALVGGTLIDGLGGAPVRNSVVILRGDRIERIGTTASLPAVSCRSRCRAPRIEIHNFGKYEMIAGAGEEVIPSIMPAICNAIFAATGR